MAGDSGQSPDCHARSSHAGQLLRIYTPLKRYSGLSTVIGAIPGHSRLCWAGQQLAEPSTKGLCSVCTVFLWQFPHFLAIAWLLRAQYAGAGLKICRVLGAGIGLLAVGYAAVLIPASLMLRSSGLAGTFYSLTAVGLGVLSVELDSVRATR